ncbi:MAG: hypothetical protein ACI8W8_003664 [Rhodothermales bacterium]|jgi:hypothetical protein
MAWVEEVASFLEGAQLLHLWRSVLVFWGPIVGRKEEDRYVGADHEGVVGDTDFVHKLLREGDAALLVADASVSLGCYSCTFPKAHTANVAHHRMIEEGFGHHFDAAIARIHVEHSTVA